MAIKIKKCDLCSSEDIPQKFRLKDRLHAIKGNFSLSICNRCGLIFQNPQLSEKELSKYYPQDYISYNKGKSPRDKMIGLLYQVYYSNKRSNFLKLLFLPVKSLLRGMPYKKNAKYLDIGCGDGSFLKLVKQMGMEPHGVDPFLKKSVQELKIKNVSLHDAKYPNEFFDFITLNNVLEHMPNPLKILIECERILKKEGKILVNVPNSTSLNYHLFSSNWVSLDAPRHLYIFSNKTLEMYGEKCNLSVNKINYKSEPFTILGSIIYVINKIFGKRDKLEGNRLISNRIVNILTLPLSILLNLLKIGDQTEVVYVKKGS